MDIDTGALREHLFLTGLAIVVSAGTVTLFGAWVVGVARDAIEDFWADRFGETAPKPFPSQPHLEEDAVLQPALECVPGAPDERHFES